jgi:hypothetical protein
MSDEKPPPLSDETRAMIDQNKRLLSGVAGITFAWADVENSMALTTARNPQRAGRPAFISNLFCSEQP